jgi:hypothetical protein
VPCREWAFLGWLSRVGRGLWLRRKLRRLVARRAARLSARCWDLWVGGGGGPGDGGDREGEEGLVERLAACQAEKEQVGLSGALDLRWP